MPRVGKAFVVVVVHEREQCELVLLAVRRPLKHNAFPFLHFPLATQQHIQHIHTVTVTRHNT